MLQYAKGYGVTGCNESVTQEMLQLLIEPGLNGTFQNFPKHPGTFGNNLEHQNDDYEKNG